MGYDLPSTWARKQISNLSTYSEKLTLFTLASYADSGGKAWPTHTRLAQDIGMSRRTIIRAMAKFLDLNLITIQKRGNQYQPTVYFLNLACDISESVGDTPVTSTLNAGDSIVSQAEKVLVTNPASACDILESACDISDTPIRGIKTHLEDPLEDPEIKEAEEDSEDTSAAINIIDLTKAYFNGYSEAIEGITEKIKDEISDFIDDYPEMPIEWVNQAFREAARHNAKSWAYVEKILLTWKDSGYHSRASPGNSGGSRYPGLHIGKRY